MHRNVELKASDPDPVRSRRVSRRTLPQDVRDFEHHEVRGVQFVVFDARQRSFGLLRRRIVDVEGGDTLFEAGCDDATFSARDGAQYGELDREATIDGEPMPDIVAALRRARADRRDPRT